MNASASRLVAGGLAALVLLAAVETATARSFDPSAQEFRFVWNPLTFSVNEGLGIVRCAVTLEGSFHSRTIAKSAGSLIGYVTSSAIGPNNVCVGGTGTVLSETLPWHVRYQAFEGALPRITGVKLRFIGIAWRIAIPSIGFTCLFLSTVAGPAGATLQLAAPVEGRSRITTVRADESLPVRAVSGTLCEGISVRFIGEGSVTQSGTATALSLTLI
jgi:hypothetical protein